MLVAFRESPGFRIYSAHCENDRRYIILNVELQNSPFFPINYYAPNDEAQQLKVLTEISNYVDTLEVSQSTQFVWAGDFNAVFHTKLDADGGSHKLKFKSIAKTISIMTQNDLCDIFKVRNPLKAR